jgi:hypothetical protein
MGCRARFAFELALPDARRPFDQDQRSLAHGGAIQRTTQSFEFSLAFEQAPSGRRHGSTIHRPAAADAQNTRGNPRGTSLVRPDLRSESSPR